MEKTKLTERNRIIKHQITLIDKIIPLRDTIEKLEKEYAQCTKSIVKLQLSED